QSMLRGELVGAGADEHDVGRLFHNGAGKRNGMTSAGDSGDGSCFEVGTVHDRGIEFIFSGSGEDGSTTCVKERIVFHETDSGFDSVERGAAFIEGVGGFLQGGLQVGSVGGFSLWVHVAAFDNACSAMEDDRPFVRLLLSV